MNNIEGAYVPLEARIKSKPNLPHGIKGIFISCGAVIGNNVTIYHQVTIGSNFTIGSKHNGAPVIGDNVVIGCGAKIIGNVKVGNNVRIGSNCIVVSDVPNNATVVMEKPSIISYDEARNNTWIPWHDR